MGGKFRGRRHWIVTTLSAIATTRRGAEGVVGLFGAKGPELGKKAPKGCRRRVVVAGVRPGSSGGRRTPENFDGARDVQRRLGWLFCVHSTGVPAMTGEAPNWMGSSFLNTFRRGVVSVEDAGRGGREGGCGRGQGREALSCC